MTLRLFRTQTWELSLLALVLAGLGWLFEGLRGAVGEGAHDDRYHIDQALAPGAIPAAALAPLAALCHHPLMQTDPQTDLQPALQPTLQPPSQPNLRPHPQAPLHWRWQRACRDVDAPSAQAWQQAGAALQADYQAVQQGLLAGQAQRVAAAAPLAKSMAEGVLGEGERGQWMQLSRELAVYRQTYHLSHALGDAPNAPVNAPPAGSMLLACAWAELSAHADRAARAGNEAAQLAARANQLALVRGTPGQLWWPQSGDVAGGDTGPSLSPSAHPGPWTASTAPACTALGPPQTAIEQASALVQQARQGTRLARKSVTMQRLQQRAPFLLAAWAGLAWGLIALGRHSRRPARLLPIVLLAWAAAGAASALVLPESGLSVPLLAWGLIAALALALWLLGRGGGVALLERWALLAPGPGQRPVSAFGLPLAVLFIGLGWWLLFDLAMHGLARNRYIALAQAPAIFGAFVLLSLMPVLSHGLAQLWLRWCGLVTLALQPRAAPNPRVNAPVIASVNAPVSAPVSAPVNAPLNPPVNATVTATHRGLAALRPWLRPVLLWALYALVLLGLALATRNWRQLTGEAFRWWLLLGVTWFFMLRAARWASGDRAGMAWWLASLLPLLVHVLLIVLALLLTDDQGPVLVVLLAGALYAGTFGAQAWRPRGAGWPAVAAMAVLIAALTTGALIGAVYAFAKLPMAPAQRVAERIDSALQPFSSDNDQLAHLHWFRQSIPATGYGLGQVPWCGSSGAGPCQGMPAQTQSDYSFTAMQGVLGRAGAFGLLSLYLLWLALLAASHAAHTQGSLHTATPAARAGAWLAWLGLCWAALVAVQTVVTVMGNLGELPLTGVTWPFVSFGSWSLLGNALFLGLLLNRFDGAPGPAEAGIAAQGSATAAAPQWLRAAP